MVIKIIESHSGLEIGLVKTHWALKGRIWIAKLTDFERVIFITVGFMRFNLFSFLYILKFDQQRNTHNLKFTVFWSESEKMSDYTR